MAQPEAFRIVQIDLLGHGGMAEFWPSFLIFHDDFLWLMIFVCLFIVFQRLRLDHIEPEYIVCAECEALCGPRTEQFAPVPSAWFGRL